jgi:hypothetical protein
MAWYRMDDPEPSRERTPPPEPPKCWACQGSGEVTVKQNGETVTVPCPRHD